MGYTDSVARGGTPIAGAHRLAGGTKPAGPLPPSGWEVLAWEDFADFPIGPFPYDYSPAAEYHDIQPEGYLGRWREAVVLHPWRGAASWNVVDAIDAIDALTGDGSGGSEPPGGEPADSQFAASGPAMEQSCVRQQYLPMLVTGSHHWSDYRLSARVRPIFTKPEPGEPVAAPMASASQGLVGILARYMDNRNYYAIAFTSDDSVQLLRSTHEGRAVLAEAPLRLDQDHTYDVSLEVAGDRLVGTVDGEPLLQASDATFATGKVGIVANIPARFQDVLVVAPDRVRQGGAGG